MGTILPMTLMTGYGVQRYSNGGQTTRCILALSILTGNIGKAGACWQYANLQSYVFDAIKEPESYFPDPDRDSPFRRSISTALLGEKMLQTHSPDLKMAWVERGNPLSQNPDTNLILEAFRKLEFRVVVEQFMTDTALEADLVLPAKSMFEQSDIIGSYWNPYVQLKQKVVEPPGEVKPETEIYYLLAERLGFDPEAIRTHLPKPTDEAIDLWLTRYLDRYPELSMGDLKKGPVLAPGWEEIAFADRIFPTPSGKIELLSETARKRWGVNILPTYEPLEEGQAGGQSRFPLSLMSPNNKNRIHSQFGNLEVIKDLEPTPLMKMNPGDARKRKIGEGEKVRVFNERGELFIQVHFDYSLRPGNVVITNGYWNTEGANPNLLSRGRETDMGHGSAFHDNLVEVEKLW
jgi:anaerobic selenocysteine-containing dehydrogenase